MPKVDRHNRTRWIVVKSTLVIAGFSLICGVVLLNMRATDLKLAIQSGNNIATSIEGEITRSIEYYDLSLKATVERISLPEMKAVDHRLRNMLLFDRSTEAESYGPIDIFDMDGKTTDSSRLHRPLSAAIGQEEFFIAHRRDPGLGLLISPPFQTLDGELVLLLTRRVNDERGTFSGVVAGSIRLSFFHDLFRRLILSKDGTVTLLRTDGTLIMRSPFDFESIGRHVDSPAERLMPVQTDGTFEMKSPIDGIERLFAWRSSRYGMVVYNGQSFGSIFADWRKQSIIIASAVLLMSAMTAFVTRSYVRELHARMAMETKFALLAMTDSLTALPNRRSFDERLSQEWQRARREGTRIALLMIDVDHFKNFNDSFGHLAGDQALKRVADCIGGSIRIGTDLAARYGGEEFAVLLPGADLDGAFTVAERIRSTIEAMPTGPRQVTVSVGISCTMPSDHEFTRLLIEADSQLYVAKETGRNRCHPCSPGPQISLVA